MKRKKKQRFALLAALALALLLAGCGGDGAPQQDPAPDPAPSGNTAPVQPENDPAPAPGKETIPADDASPAGQPEAQGPEDDPPAEAPPEDAAPTETAPADSQPEPEPVPDQEPEPESTPEPEPEAEPEPTQSYADGSYTASVALEGGTGRATVESPAKLRCEGGQFWAAIVWSSPNYDYMKVDGEKYLQTNTEGNSTFEIPVAAFDQKLPVIADTIAMSEPHEVEYTLYFDSASLQAQ